MQKNRSAPPLSTRRSNLQAKFRARMLPLLILSCVNAKIWNLFVDEKGKTSEQAQEDELSYEKAEPCL